MSVHEVVGKSQLDDILSSHALVVIDFTATWCGPCQMIKPKFKELAEEKSSDSLAFVTVDVDEDDNAEICEEYGVESMPTFKFVKNGATIDSVIGNKFDDVKAGVVKHTS